MRTCTRSQHTCCSMRLVVGGLPQWQAQAPASHLAVPINHGLAASAAARRGQQCCQGHSRGGCPDQYGAHSSHAQSTPQPARHTAAGLSSAATPSTPNTQAYHTREQPRRHACLQVQLPLPACCAAFAAHLQLCIHCKPRLGPARASDARRTQNRPGDEARVVLHVRATHPALPWQLSRRSRPTHTAAGCTSTQAGTAQQHCCASPRHLCST